MEDLKLASTWQVSDTSFSPDRQHHLETILTQGNGYLCTRGTFEEQYPGNRQATLVHGIWDDIPIAYTELVNAPDWTALEVRVAGQRFAMDEGIVEGYTRSLDLRNGLLSRHLRWTPPGGQPPIDLTFERFTSLAEPHLLLIRVQVQALDHSVPLEIRGWLNAHVDNEGRLHWQPQLHESDPEGESLLVRTLTTHKSLAMSARMVVHHGDDGDVTKQRFSDNSGLVVHTSLETGQELTLEKFVSIFTSRDVEDPLAASQAKVDEAVRLGYEALRQANDEAWSKFWAVSDVIIEGDDEAQLAVRHGLYQLRIAAPTKDERASVGAKTLSGFGYKGHIFWDNEIFVLPFFMYTQPDLARNMLMYRWHTLEGARRIADENGFSGAQFAWESAETGDEVTPRWVPDSKDPSKMIRIWPGDIELHITADIAYSIWQYWQVTGDDVFMRAHGAPIILETALFWGDRAEPENGHYAIRDVIGPDEYHDHVDNNAFTNGMVKWHLERALEIHEWLGRTSPEDLRALEGRLDLTPERLAHWREVADDLIFLHDTQTGLIEQFEGFFQLAEVDWAQFENRSLSMQVLLGIEGANQHQVLKQPDVLMLLCLHRDRFDHLTWQANWDYYTPRTDHTYGSSLGPAIHAWAACEMDQVDEAYEHFMRAARVDIGDIRGNTGDGIHAASAGGLWQALVFGFAGLRLKQDGCVLNPRLPSHWKRLAFRIQRRGEWHSIDIRPESKSDVRDQ